MRQQTTKILFDYWNEVRGTRVTPRRFDIEPARIAAILPETFILERHDASTYRFRLAGTRICDRFRVELRNRNFFDLVGLDHHPILKDYLRVIAERGAAGLFEFETKDAERGSGRMEILILPLTDTRDVVTRFVGSMSIVDAPSWPDTAITLKAMLRHELVWPDGRPNAPAIANPPRPPFRPIISPARVVTSKLRKFRVYDGGKSDCPAKNT
jgi:hypothetical protein